MRYVLLSIAMILNGAAFCAAGPESTPLVRVVDLKQNQTQRVELHDGSQVTLRLTDLSAKRESVLGMLALTRATVEVNGTPVTLESGNYRLPVTVGNVQIDCPLTGHYNADSHIDHWALEADARVRVWPADSPWIRPGTFVYPLRQRWFAAMTWFSNEPVSARPNGEFYYHAGMDLGATEGSAEVIAATDGVVISSGLDVLDGEHPAAQPRGDVVYIRDGRGWYYRYSHLKEIDSAMKPGRPVQIGQRVGLVGKEGASGGWSHLHFEIKSLQPSGRWGTQDSYAFLWQAYRSQYDPKVIAVARPHRRVRTGERVTLDGSRSWAEEGVASYTWMLTDGTKADGPTVDRRYDRPGLYSEILKITDPEGRVAYDFASVRVADRLTGRPGPVIDGNFHPTFNIAPGDEITFTSRGRDPEPSEDTWDFGDGSPPVTVRSNIDSSPHAANGYARVTHRYSEPGHYLVTVRRKNDRGEVAMQRYYVPVGVEEPGT